MQTLRHNRRMALEAFQQGAASDDVAREESELPPLLLKMDLDAGHFSASDRYSHLRELAFCWAFLLDRLYVASSAVPTVALHIEASVDEVKSSSRDQMEDRQPDRLSKFDL